MYKLSQTQYDDFVARYDSSPTKEWYRFGQAFINEYKEKYNAQLFDPDTFYAGRSKAEQRIKAQYVQLTAKEALDAVMADIDNMPPAEFHAQLEKYRDDLTLDIHETLNSTKPPNQDKNDY